MSKPFDFFTEQMAEHYDEKNRALAPISQNMHFLVGLALHDLPSDAKILCVGAGTGAEILSLAKTYPGWNFVASEPSAAMLSVCRKRVEAAGLSARCEFVPGYIQDVPAAARFDAVLSILVGHFIPKAERASFVQAAHSRLKHGGLFVNSEISFDLDAPEFPLILKNWEQVQIRMGANADSLAKLPQMMRDVLTILPPTEVESLFRQGGFRTPVLFFQAFMIHGWWMRKDS